MTEKKVYNEDGDLLVLNCPVCGNLAFPYEGSFRVCPTCGWIDDYVQKEEPDEDYCANFMSLNQARKAWKEGRPIE